MVLKHLVLRVSALVTVIGVPTFVFAQDPSFGGIGRLISDVLSLIEWYLIPLVFSLSFLLFLWGLFNFFFVGGGNAESREAGRQLMMWGIVAFVVMVSIWGIVSVVAYSFGFSGGYVPPLPSIPMPGGGSGGGGAPMPPPAAPPVSGGPTAMPWEPGIY